MTQLGLPMAGYTPGAPRHLWMTPPYVALWIRENFLDVKLSCRRDDFVIPTTGEFAALVESVTLHEGSVGIGETFFPDTCIGSSSMARVSGKFLERLSYSWGRSSHLRFPMLYDSLRLESARRPRARNGGGWPLIERALVSISPTLHRKTSVSLVR